MIILILLTYLIFYPTNKYKKLKTKEEQLFCQKTFITAIFFILTLFINILATTSESSLSLYLLIIFLFNIFIIVISLYNFFISFELYSTFTNPVHYFNRLLKQKKYNYFEEFIIVIVGIIIFIFDFFLFGLGAYEIRKNNIKPRHYKDDDKDFYCNESSLFIIIGGKSFLLLIISIISLIIYFKTKSKVQKFSFKNQEKVLIIIEKRTLSIYLYIVYSLYYILPIMVGSGLTELYNIFGNIFFLFIIFNDFIIHISIIATSKFCEYRLKNTLLGYFCSFFIKIPKSNSSVDAPLLTPYEPIGKTPLNKNAKSDLEMNTINLKDKELVSSFTNGIFIEDYFLGFFDQILNIITSSMFESYNSIYFSSQASEKSLNNNIKIGDISSISGTLQNLTVSNFGYANNIKAVLSTKNEIGDDIISFTLTKNNEKDDFRRYKEVLESDIKINNYNNYLNINLKSFCTPKCVESIYNQKLKGKQIGCSLLNHMIFSNNPKNKKLDNSYFWSLLAANVKEEHFNNLNNTSIKTFDKNFTLDIFDTDDEEININNKIKINDLAVLLDKYFIYISAKGIKGTFITSLLGDFKLKINDFKTLLVFVTRNSLVENVPKNYFTYWQLIQFSKDKPTKVASS